jgi:hypothetical protein
MQVFMSVTTGSWTLNNVLIFRNGTVQFVTEVPFEPVKDYNKVLFYPMFLDFRNNIDIRRSPRIARLSLSKSSMQMKMSMKSWWNDTDRGVSKW